MKAPHQQTLVDLITASVGSVASLVIHTLAFLAAFALGFFGILAWDLVLLVLTTIVSLEAIYLAIFIQMTVNRNTASLEEVEEDIEEIQEDVEELGEDVDEMQEDIEEIQEGVDEIQEEVEEMHDAEGEAPVSGRTLEELTTDIRAILKDLEALKGKG